MKTKILAIILMIVINENCLNAQSISDDYRKLIEEAKLDQRKYIEQIKTIFKSIAVVERRENKKDIEPEASRDELAMEPKTAEEKEETIEALSIPYGLPFVNQEVNISSNYGFRKDPFTGRKKFHTGIDLAMPIGTAIILPMSGEVTKVGYDKVSGNYVKIKHNEAYTTLYCHLSKVNVRVGDKVNPGTVIAYSGNTGRSTGPHLHYQVFLNEKTINPINLLK